MRKEHWPKEEQRLRNGASGQVPVSGRDAFASGNYLALEWLRLEPTPEESATAKHRAMDAADSMLAESLDMAQNVIGLSLSLRKEVLALAAAHAQVAATLYAAHELNAVLRELAPEIAGAISEAGTDVGAGIVQGLQALKPRMRNCTK